MTKYELLSKYAKKFATKQGGTRPILEGIHYAAGGTACVTDGHVLLRIRNAHQFETPATINIYSGMPIEGVYPDVSKAFPNSFDHEIQIGAMSIKDVLTRVTCAADVAKRLDKKAPVVHLSADNGTVYMLVNDADKKIEFRGFFGNTLKVATKRWSLSAEFLQLAVSLFADAGRDVSVNLAGSMSPIVLTDNEDIDVLILPYRIAN